MNVLNDCSRFWQNVVKTQLSAHAERDNVWIVSGSQKCCQEAHKTAPETQQKTTPRQHVPHGSQFRHSSRELLCIFTFLYWRSFMMNKVKGGKIWIIGHTSTSSHRSVLCFCTVHRGCKGCPLHVHSNFAAPFFFFLTLSNKTLRTRSLKGKIYTKSFLLTIIVPMILQGVVAVTGHDNSSKQEVWTCTTLTNSTCEVRQGQLTGPTHFCGQPWLWVHSVPLHQQSASSVLVILGQSY